MKFFEELQGRLDKYKKLYQQEPNKAALKLSVWAFQHIFKKYHNYKEKNKNIINIAFYIDGGIGDLLINLNYIWYFVKAFNSNCLTIDLYVSSKKVLNILLSNDMVINNIYTIESFNQNNSSYDIVCKLIRFPVFICYNEGKIKTKYSHLADYLENNKKFVLENSKVFNSIPTYDCVANSLSVINGKKRIQQPDFYNLLDIEKDFKLPIIVSDEQKILEKYNLKNLKYITINREVGTYQVNDISTKMWPVGYYADLIRLLKDSNPELKFIQIGSSSLRSKIIENVDINLIGQTTLADVKVLLKNACLHIDGEGGMVHLRKALTEKPSVVLFTSTDSRFYGYDNNLNLKADNACPMACEWLTDDWQAKCMRGEKYPPCSYMLKPEYVFKEIINKELLSFNKGI